MNSAVHGAVLTPQPFGALSRPSGDTPARDVDAALTWHALGLETMASLLVLSLHRLGDRYFEGRCQWPRTHPLNERGTTVAHHPLIVVESTRQLAVAVQRRHLPTASPADCEVLSVGLGLLPHLVPMESGSATDVAVRLTLTDVVARPGTAASFRVTAEYLYAGRVFATCVMRCASPLGEGREPAGVVPPGPGLLHPAAAAVGAAADPDVLLARGPQGRLVIAPRDPAHPVLLPGRPSRLTTAAVLEAGRQAVLLSCGMTARAVVGLRADVRSPVPGRGAVVDVTFEQSRARFAVSAAGHVVASGAVSLLRS
ncbi:AfsA-related hotdog domain-containing protein [Streptomyces sp. NPDC051913]|uniref:AfsA-related hotdog domain-containing protein n=1 Tax=Streptomyces sp. NPDC051913 TaxID=3365676 RepID=UPI0037D198E6